MKRIILRIFKITGISIAGFLLLLFLAPICFPGTVTEKIKTWTNNSLDGELNFSKVRLSFFKHFPSLTVTLYDFTLKGSAPYKKDTLVNAGEIALGVNVKSLIFDKSVRINKIFVSDALINVKVDEKGAANYNVYVSGKKKDSTATSDTSSAGLKLEKIIIENSHLVYNDLSVPILINAKGFNYSGSGDLSEAIFDLQSHAKIDSLDFTLSGESYLVNKKIEADLITQINTHSLSFLFQKNLLHINKLPVAFEGKMDFLSNGYDLDFTVSSLKSELHDFITALPPQYLNWLDKTTVKGTTDILLTLKGKYVAANNSSPNLAFNMNLKNGFIAYEGAAEPATNLQLNFETKIPRLNTDSMQVKLDSLFFNIGKDYFSASIHTKGLTAPYITSNINCSLDVEKLDKAFGFENVNLKGIYNCNFTAEGIYRKGPNPNSLRHEITTLSIPHFTLASSLQNGYIKYDSLPLAINNISFNLNSACKNGDYKSTSIAIENLSANAGANFVKGHASINSIKDLLLDANIQSTINLAEIRKMIPVTGLELAGLLKLDINGKGKIDASKKSFPQTNAAIQLDNASIKTSYYPHPIENLHLTANASDANGSLKDLQLNIQPSSFMFEGKAFTIEAVLKNFDDINYNIKAKGELDLGRISLVFAQKGTNVTGYVKADLSLKGRQSDAMNGRYNSLNNQGVLELREIRAEHENFPQAFIIKQGVFKFNQDKVWFTNFKAAYGQSDFTMSGYLQNIIEYALNGKGKLKGNFTLTSEYLNADEFMAFAPTKDSVQNNQSKNPPSSTGVIIIPANLDLQLQANAQKLSYNGLEIKNAKANLNISSGSLSLKETGFNLIGCDVTMDAVYGSMSPVKAYFDYKLKATDFDIRKAYNEVKLFHDMASAAGKAQGIVSLDYALKGKLDANMHPVYPSLEGGGVLSIKNIKLAGFKLFNAVAKKTGKDSLSNPDLNKVDIKSTVKNNIIKIERFKMKIAGFRPRIEGETSFDGRINLKMRLGLPPLGIIGIPMHITGTQENPQIKLGKGDNEEIPETEEKEK